jgi:uncharacterized membrane protein YjfL (UPF0719 family)
VLNITGVVGSIVFGLIGIILAMIGYKIYDWITPMKLDEELSRGNTAAAIVVGSIFIGISIIIAAAVFG